MEAQIYYFFIEFGCGVNVKFMGQGVGTVVNTYTSIYNGDATQIPKGYIGGYTQNNSAVPTVTAAIQTPDTYYYLLAGKETWEYTWYNFADIPLWSNYGINKSIYDPCPYGYRVPNNGSWTGFPSTTWIVMINEGTVWSSTWWPTGYRTASGGALINVGNNGYCWSSARCSVAYGSYGLLFYYTGAVDPSGTHYRGCGFSVRCVQEKRRTSGRGFGTRG